MLVLMLVGQVFAWDGDAQVEMDSLRCLHNTAGEQGGCLYTAAGDTQVHDEVLMEDNNGTYGGCICEYACFPRAVRSS